MGEKSIIRREPTAEPCEIQDNPPTTKDGLGAKHKRPQTERIKYIGFCFSGGL